MRKIITYGTFDLLHVGHLQLLMRARDLGDHLTVGISTDEFNWNEKQKTCIIPYTDRDSLIYNLKCVDDTIGESCWDQKVSDIIEHEIDVFVMGDDWKGKFDHLTSYCDVVYLPRTENISSSDLKTFIKTSTASSRSFASVTGVN